MLNFSYNIDNGNSKLILVGKNAPQKIWRYFKGRKFRDFAIFLPKLRKLDPAKNSETFNLQKFILVKYSKIGYSPKLIPAKKTNFFELD